MKLFKPKFWDNKNSLISFFLIPISIFVQFLMILKKTFVTKKKFNFPIFCVGNIYLGGTGKTPLSIEIAEILKKFGKKTAIIKKSYKNHRDEFKLIESKKIKLFTNTSRIKAVKKAEIEKFDCVVLDDGLQDASITKDLNIVCFNGKKLAGNEMTLPSGPLREPLSTLKNNQIVVINGDVNKIFEKRIRAMSKHINIYYSQYLPKNLTEFKNQNLLAFAGIGNPNNFFNLLEKNNLQVKKKIAFPDHYNYSLKELNNLVKYSKSNNLKIVTTEKDYFRIKHHRISQIKHLIIKLKIKKRAKFERELIKCFL